MSKYSHISGIEDLDPEYVAGLERCVKYGIFESVEKAIVEFPKMMHRTFPNDPRFKPKKTKNSLKR